MTITFPDDTKSIKDAIRNEIGKIATFILEGDKEACSRCAASGWYDPVNDTSLDPWCPVCSGAYWINWQVSSGIMAHVRWRSGDEKDFGPAGYSLEGKVSVTISSTSLTDTQIKTVKEIQVDGRILNPTESVKRGSPRDRIRFICDEMERS